MVARHAKRDASLSPLDALRRAKQATNGDHPMPTLKAIYTCEYKDPTGAIRTARPGQVFETDTASAVSFMSMKAAAMVQSDSDPASSDASGLQSSSTAAPPADASDLQPATTASVSTTFTANPSATPAEDAEQAAQEAVNAKAAAEQKAADELAQAQAAEAAAKEAEDQAARDKAAADELL
jgi:hypothetical protein